MLLSCSEDSEKAAFSVRMTDAPAEDYKEVNVDIREVHVHTSATADEKDDHWIKLSTTEIGVINLLELTGGADTLLAQSELPAGKISQVRLVLGENNTLKLESGEIVPLNTPSAQQSGLKIKINAELEEGKHYTLTLDFDAGRSVVKAGAGKYNLKPTIRTIVDFKTAIQGKIIPMPDTQLPVYAIMGADTLGGTHTDGGGAFLIQGLKAGTYHVVIETQEMKKTLEDISIDLGEIKNVGEVTLQ